jgi:hypothetical protein
MGTVLTPNRTYPPEDTSPTGRLAATMVQVAVAGLADPQRFRRGKAYLADRAVTRLEIDQGSLRATVQGSRSDAYRVVITCPTVARPADLTGDQPARHHVAGLVPEAGQLLCSCTCPDWDDPCKHAVAVLLALANELSARPELLVTWRCGPGNGARAEVGARGRGQRGHLRLVSSGRPSPPVDPYASPEWQQFFGTDIASGELAAPRLELPNHELALGSPLDDVVASVADALHTLRAMHPLR